MFATFSDSWMARQRNYTLSPIDKVSWLDPHAGTHSSTQVRRVNQWVSLGLNFCVEIRFRWHSDFIFPQTSPFLLFLQTELKFNFSLFTFWCLASVSLSTLCFKVEFYYCVSPIPLIFKGLEVSRVRLLSVITYSRSITN